MRAILRVPLRLPLHLNAPSGSSWASSGPLPSPHERQPPASTSVQKMQCFATRKPPRHRRKSRKQRRRDRAPREHDNGVRNASPSQDHPGSAVARKNIIFGPGRPPTFCPLPSCHAQKYNRNTGHTFSEPRQSGPFYRDAPQCYAGRVLCRCFTRFPLDLTT